MEETEKKTKYSTVKEVSNDIHRISEIAETLKSLYFNKDNVDTEAILKYEAEFADRKMDIVEYLKDSVRYDMFRTSPDARHALFFKKVQENFFEMEIGFDMELKEKIYRDFSDSLSKMAPETLVTPQEKRNQQMFEAMSEEDKERYRDISKLIYQIHHETRTFQMNWNYLLANLPEFLDATGKRVLSLVKNNPHFLKDHPNHFLKNKGSYTNLAPNTQELNEAFQGAATGYTESKEKLSRYEKIFSDFESKKPEEEAIIQIREKALGNTLDQKARNKLQ